MKTLTLEQVHSLIFLFGVIFILIPTAISLLVASVVCKEENRKGTPNTICSISLLVVFFNLFVSGYIGFNDSEITKSLFLFINKGIVSDNTFFYLLIASVEVLVFFSMLFFGLVFNDKKNN